MVGAMDAIEALHKRVSVPRLGGEAPDAIMRDKIFRAALRAPDHAQLRPWRFIQIEGEVRDLLGELFARAKQVAEPNVSARDLVKARAKPLRAPRSEEHTSELQSHHDLVFGLLLEKKNATQNEAAKISCHHAR